MTWDMGKGCHNSPGWYKAPWHADSLGYTIMGLCSHPGAALLPGGITKMPKGCHVPGGILHMPRGCPIFPWDCTDAQRLPDSCVGLRDGPGAALFLQGIMKPCERFPSTLWDYADAQGFCVARAQRLPYYLVGLCTCPGRGALFLYGIVKPCRRFPTILWGYAHAQGLPYFCTGP